MATERLEHSLGNHINSDAWGFKPIRCLADGSVDHGYYLARGRQARSQAVLAAVKTLFRSIKRLITFNDAISQTQQPVEQPLRKRLSIVT
ncbi:MAG: hypothetical protein HC808_16970 [Candidatus Competibacteraceae bacterium]|nr:hypothetical protein [Candidatus Competibacteraceae bacterium]